MGQIKKGTWNIMLNSPYVLSMIMYDNVPLSFDLTHSRPLWQKSGNSFIMGFWMKWGQGNLLLKFPDPLPIPEDWKPSLVILEAYNFQYNEKTRKLESTSWIHTNT